MASLLDLFGGGDNSAVRDATQDARNAYANVAVPDLTWTTYAPEAYDPTLANANLVQDDSLTKSAQLAALQKMGDLANNGLSAVDQQGYEQARNLGNQMASSGSQAALQNAAARGLAGSGMEFAQREIANQAGAQRAQESALQQAADSARQRALYTQAYDNALGGFRSQNNNLSAQNAGILNQFNMANTGALNQAQQYNVGNQNQAQLINQQGQTGIAQQNFQNQMSRAGGIAGADQGIAKAGAAQQAANTAAMGNMLNFGLGAGRLAMAGKPSAGTSGYGGYNNYKMTGDPSDYNGVA